MMDYLHDRLLPVHSHPWFRKITGSLALANPIAMSPMWWETVCSGERPGGAETFLLFVLLQVVFALVAVQTKNHGMFVSMVVSCLMSLTIGLR